MDDYLIKDKRRMVNPSINETPNGRLSHDKHFAAVVKCGHAHSLKYYMVELIGTCAKDKESALSFIKNLPRGAKSRKDYIVDFCEISNEEFLLIDLINSYNPFFHATSKQDDDSEDIERRRIAKEECLSEIYHIKTADEYDDDCIVERYCAPRKIGTRIVYPQKLNMRQLLDEYFQHWTQILGCDGGDIRTISLYYHIFGRNNNLSIKYDQTNSVITFTDSNGNLCSIEVCGRIKEHLDATEDKIIQQLQQEQEYISIPAEKSRRPSPAIKFNARLAKAKNNPRNNLTTTEDTEESES